MEGELGGFLLDFRVYRGFEFWVLLGGFEGGVLSLGLVLVSC